MEHPRIIPPSYLLPRAFVTDRSFQHIMDVTQTPNTISSNDTVVSAGSGLFLKTERQLKKTGASIVIIDPSLAFTNDSYRACKVPSPEWGQGMMYRGKHTQYQREEYLSDQEFQQLQKDRLALAGEVASVICLDPMPSVSFTRTVRSVTHFFDCYGPIAKIQDTEALLTYILLTQKCLAHNGTATFFPIQDLQKFENIVQTGNVEFTPYEVKDKGISRIGVKIKRD